MMNPAPDCNTCRAWDRNPPGHPEPDRGICRRRPPSPEIVFTAGDDGAEFIQIVPVWPHTTATGEGCFEHLAIDDAREAGSI